MSNFDTSLPRRGHMLAVAIGAIGSLAFMLYAGRNNPSMFLMVLFTIWVLGPFAVLAWANQRSARWSDRTRRALQTSMWILAAGSIAAYSYNALFPRKAQPAFFFVLVPVASVLFLIVFVSITALTGRRLETR